MTEKAKKNGIVRPVLVELAGAEIVSGSARIELGQLDGAIAARFNHGDGGAPERAVASWVVRCSAGTELSVIASHQRAGTKAAVITT